MTVDCLTAYQALAGKHALPALERAGLDQRSWVETGAEAVIRQLTEFAPRQGWIQSASELVRFTAPGEFVPGTGPIVAAECVNDDGESLHIRYTADTWRCVRARRDPAGSNLLVETRRYLSEPAELGGIVYEVFLAYSEADGWHPHFARFAGFDKGTAR